MRISNYSMARNYRNNLNQAQYDLYKANERVRTGRRFYSMDEDVAAGVRAFSVRRNVQKVETYIDNVKEAQSFYRAAEDYVDGMVEVGQSVSELYVSALNGEKTPDEYTAIVAQVRHLQEELLANLNKSFSDRYLFGGSQTSSAPFSLDPDTGELVYSYKDTDGFYHSAKVKDIDRNDPQYAKVFDDPSFLDVGLGLRLDGTKEIIPSSAFNRSVNGLEIIGTGETNMYDTIGAIVKSLEDGAPQFELLTQVNNAYKAAAVTLTQIGAQVKYLDTNLDRLQSERLNLIDRQQGLEFIPEEEAIIDWKMRDYAYNAALAMGQKLLQPSLFSFLV